MDEETKQEQEARAEIPVASKEDVEKNKSMAIIGYVLPILFFIPLVTEAKDSKFAKFHANQQLNLLILCVAGMVISPLLFVLLIGFLIMPIVWVVEVILVILGVINAVNGEMKKLPVIGGFQFIK